MNALDVFSSFGKAVELTEEENTGCAFVSEVRHVALSPKYIGRLRTGVSELLDAELGRFSESLRGVLLAYGNLKLLHSSGVIVDDSPFIHFDVKLDAVVFKPKIGSLLKCVVNEQASDHVGCLVHDWFNVSLLATRKELNGQRQLRLEPGYVVLVQVQQLRALNGMLAIEARAPDDGSDLILEVISRDTDNESIVDTVNQPSVSDNPDGQGLSTEGASCEKKKNKKKKHSQPKQDKDVDSHQQSPCHDEPSGETQTDNETTSPRKSKKHKRREATAGTNGSPSPSGTAAAAAGEETTEGKKRKKWPVKMEALDSADGSTQLTTGEETTHVKKKKKKKHLKTETEDDPSAAAPDDGLVQIATGGETSRTRKEKKKRTEGGVLGACVDSDQPPVTPNGPVTVEDLKAEEVPRVERKKKRMTSEGVVSLQSPPSPPDQNFTKLKKKKHRDEGCGTPIVSSHQPLLSDLHSSTTEGTADQKVKKRKHRTKSEKATDGEYDTSCPGGSFAVQKEEPGAETTTEVSWKSHKKQKRKAVDGEEVNDTVTNGSSKKKKKNREV